QRMAGVVAALEAHHDVGAAGEPIDDLALALVTPLGADHGHVGHAYASRVAMPRLSGSARRPDRCLAGMAGRATSGEAVVGCAARRGRTGVEGDAARTLSVAPWWIKLRGACGQERVRSHAGSGRL